MSNKTQEKTDFGGLRDSTKYRKTMLHSLNQIMMNYGAIDAKTYIEMERMINNKNA